jgi:glycosyltransferase involved in cell wall biosynthesis
MKSHLWFSENTDVPTQSPWVSGHRLRHGIWPKDPSPEEIHYVADVKSRLATYSGCKIGLLDLDDETIWDVSRAVSRQVDLYLWNTASTIGAPPSMVHDLAFETPAPGSCDVIVVGYRIWQALPGIAEFALGALTSRGAILMPSATDLSSSALAMDNAQSTPHLFVWRRTRINLLMVAPGLVAGGADRALIDLINGLDSNQFNLYLATTEPQSNIWIKHILNRVTEYWDIGSMGTDHLMRQNMLQHVVMTKHVDQMYIMHSQIGFDILPWLKAHTYVKTIAQFHLEEPGGGWIQYALSRYQNLIDRIVVISHDLKQQLIAKYYVEPHKISVVYLGLAVPDSPTPPPLPASAGEIRILYPARLDPQKAPGRVVDIAQMLQLQQINAIIDVVGSGSLETDLRNMLRRTRLESKVLLHGAEDPAKMRQWYQKSHAVLLTSDYEGLPLVILEAMAEGRPAIAPDLGATREVITPDTGFLIPEPSNISAYVHAIDELAHNPRLVETLGAAAHRRVQQQFDPHDTLKKYQEIFFGLTRPVT